MCANPFGNMYMRSLRLMLRIFFARLPWQQDTQTIITEFLEMSTPSICVLSTFFAIHRLVPILLVIAGQRQKLKHTRGVGVVHVGFDAIGY